jgi:hypothetical protein
MDLIKLLWYLVKKGYGISADVKEDKLDASIFSV